MSGPRPTQTGARRAWLRWLAAAPWAAGGLSPAAEPAAGIGRPVKVLRPDWPPGPALPAWAAGRALRVYLPPSHGQGRRRFPVIYMPDGQNLFDAATSHAGEWGVDETLDALAASDGIEAIVVGIDHGGARRNQELSPWSHPRIGSAEGAAYLAFVLDVVKPWVDGHWRTLPGRAHTRMIGSSLGGLMAHWALHQRPEVLGGVGVLSPAYWVSEAVVQNTRDHPRPADARVFLYAGGAEGPDLLERVQRMHALLAGQTAASAPAAAAGALQLAIEPAAGHNEAAWRAVLARALRCLLDAPTQDAPTQDAPTQDAPTR